MVAETVTEPATTSTTELNPRLNNLEIAPSEGADSQQPTTSSTTFEPDIPTLSLSNIVGNGLPTPIGPFTEVFREHPAEGQTFSYHLPWGWERMDMFGKSKDVKHMENDEPQRMLSIDVLGTINDESGTPRLRGAEAVEFVKTIFDCEVNDGRCTQPEILSVVCNPAHEAAHEIAVTVEASEEGSEPAAAETADAPVPVVPTVPVVQALLCGLAHLGEVPQAEGSPMDGIVDVITPREISYTERNVISRDSREGDNIKKKYTVAIVEVNGCYVLLTLERTCYEEVLWTHRAIGRYLYNTWSWVRGYEQWEPPPDPFIGADVDFLQRLAKVCKWTDEQQLKAREAAANDDGSTV